MIDRRKFLGMTAGAGASLALAPELLRALQASGGRDGVFVQPAGKLLHRTVPSTGESLPIISYGPRETDGAAMKEVLKTLVDNGGRMVDVLHGGPAGENGARAAAVELGIQDKLFWTTPLGVSVPVLPGYAGPPLKADPAAIRAAMEEKFAAFKVRTIDLVMVSAAVDVRTHVEVLRELKKAGRIRYIGVHELLFPPNFPSPAPTTARLEEIMRGEAIDFIGVDYSVGDRRIEDVILPLAQEKKVAVMAYFPFDRNRIFQRASSTPLPEWAAEFDAKTWAQFFLKYVASHPAVTVVRTGTTKAAHMLDNIGGGSGRLPTEAMRRRMAQLVDSFPPTPPPGPPQQVQIPQQGQRPQQPPLVLPVATLDRVVGEYSYVAANQKVTIRRDGERLFVKIEGSAPEGPLAARSETRFQGPFGLVYDFKVDASGKVTGAIVEQGPFRIPLDRKSP